MQTNRMAWIQVLFHVGVVDFDVSPSLMFELCAWP